MSTILKEIASNPVATKRAHGPAAPTPPEVQPAETGPTVLVERRNRVGLVTLNRPRDLNYLNKALASAVLEALQQFDADPGIGAIVITGSPRVFSAGADIGEMAEKTLVDLLENDIFAAWDRARQVSKPMIAAVSGFALGGGCELAMMCDFIVASEDAKFGLPEIKLGILPGIGGTQRLTRAVGKALALDMILTGRTIDAAEARAVGLVSRVVAPANLLQTALEAAHTIAGYNAPAVRMAKEAANRAFETTLTEGMLHERRLFQAAFGTEGQKEGMRAFAEKRAPVFKNP
jgi:enoyl-CoA hydratase